MGKVISLREAKKLKVKRYFTGKPCKRGHVSERKTSNRACTVCSKHKQKTPTAIKVYKQWIKDNPNKVSIISKRYKKRNFKKILADTRYRNLKKCFATPEWVNRKALQFIYENCPEGYQVDHIVPIRNLLVSGLHVPENLQYLKVKDNQTKSNKFTPYYEKPDGTIELIHEES